VTIGLSLCDFFGFGHLDNGFGSGGGATDKLGRLGKVNLTGASDIATVRDR